jgi:hypothetical protein
MRTRYNQQSTTLIVDGVVILDFFEGASIVFTVEGGEVEKTQGTDGPSINMATPQGARLRFHLRETSRSHAFLADLHRSQQNGGPGVTIVLTTGAEMQRQLTDAYMTPPGELSTGDKKMGGMEYTFVSSDYTDGNLGNYDNLTI